MSNIDKRALREAAERAESDSWGYDRDEFNEALTPSTVLALLDELEAKDKQIAELEAREVVLPQRYSMLHRVDFDEPYHTEMVYKQHQVLEALHDAGVNIAAAGKGE
ncbi:ead/Ea22-like family protein [Enterobacter cloacae]|uniref:ead/Ea22-like family protein n=1 Tax=Enterobacter cloacae TaxID=550 RepID=UPI001F25CC5A|nr:ead/Ea22-like family protein [Enterobacter cloacae]UJB37069.1 ead/Ea22-like family protein [Enterobacter cloacae]